MTSLRLHVCLCHGIDLNQGRCGLSHWTDFIPISGTLNKNHNEFIKCVFNGYQTEVVSLQHLQQTGIQTTDRITDGQTEINRQTNGEVFE